VQGHRDDRTQPGCACAVGEQPRLLAGGEDPRPLTPEELELMSAQREKEYAANELLDVELGISVPETGNDLMAAAAVDLKSRGIVLADASQEELLGALSRVSS